MPVSVLSSQRGQVKSQQLVGGHPRGSRRSGWRSAACGQRTSSASSRTLRRGDASSPPALPIPAAQMSRWLQIKARQHKASSYRLNTDYRPSVHVYESVGRCQRDRSIYHLAGLVGGLVTHDKQFLEPDRELRRLLVLQETRDG